MKIVTGCAGFIGSNLVDRLLLLGHKVVGIDNFSTGQRRFLEGALGHPEFRLVEADLLDLPALTAAMEGGDCVFHLAANADVRFGTEHPRRDLEQNTIATFNVLEAMRANGIKRIAFSSTGSVYGEATVVPTPENAPFPIQTSLYGASKLAGEGLIAAYCEGFGFQAWIFRFVSILGERYTHGHVFDFYKQLRAIRPRFASSATASSASRTSTSRIASTRCSWRSSGRDDKVNIFNLGTDEYCQVNDSIGWICERSELRPGATTPAAIAAGSATTRSSFSIRRRFARSAGRRSSTIRQGSRADGRLPSGERVGARGARHEDLRLRASGISAP